MPKTSRKYPTKHKTSTRQGKNEYMRQYMRDIRRQQRQAFKQLQTKYPKVFIELFGKQKRRSKKK